jgi:transcriptional regulator with XRE-family HTH domain
MGGLTMDVSEEQWSRQEQPDERPVTGARHVLEDDVGRGTDHARWLRSVLKAERIRRGWSLQETADVVAREWGRDKLSKQSLQDWEEFKTQPKIDAFAAWARALGLRLEVDLVQSADPSVAIRVPIELADVCRTLSVLPPADRQVIIDMITRLQRHVT